MSIKKKKQKPVHVGLSVTHSAVEIAVFNPKTFTVEQSASFAVPDGLFDDDGDRINNAILLKEILSQAVKSIKPKPAMVHLSLPGTLLRITEMPKVGEKEFFVSLSSEAERYKAFDDSDAIVDYWQVDIPVPNLPKDHVMVAFGAVRNDSLEIYQRIFKKDLKVKLASVTLEPLNILRAMAGTGVLDGLVNQIGMESYWGTIFVEPTRIRISMWQADRLVELRETQMHTNEFAIAAPDSMVVEDVMEEIRRTTKMAQPVIWLTHNMPANMEQILSDRMGVPFRTAPLGDAPGLQDAGVQIATIGTALTSFVEYPFPFDILNGVGVSYGGASTDESSSSNVDWMIPAGAAVLALSVIVYGALWAATGIAGWRIPELQNQQSAVDADLATATAREKELQGKVDVDTKLVDLITQASVRNFIYVRLTEDLRKKTPPNTWVHTLSVNEAENTVEMIGVTKEHEEAIHLARSFDHLKYLNTMKIDTIEQDKLNGVSVFHFKLTGEINPDPTLLKYLSQSTQPADESGSTGESSKTSPGGV